MARALALLVALALLACVAASAAVAAGPTLLRQDSTSEFAVRPATIGYTGDGSGVLGGRGSASRHDFGKLNWVAWTGTRARAHGYAWVDDCSPSCAQGSFHPHRATVTAGAVHGGHFTLMTIRFKLGHRRVTDSRRLRYVAPSSASGGFWEWAIR